MEIIKLTNENFDEVVNNTDKKVLIDFWASWCMPCQAAAPVLDDLAASDPDFIIGKVNVDEQPELRDRFMVRSIPMFVVMKNGEKAAVALGPQSKSAFMKLVQDA